MYGEQDKEPPKSDQENSKRDEFKKCRKIKNWLQQYRVAKDQETIAKMINKEQE